MCECVIAIDYIDAIAHTLVVEKVKGLENELKESETTVRQLQVQHVRIIRSLV